MLKSVKYVMDSPRDSNAIHNNKISITGIKNAAFCKDINLQQLKKKAQQMNVTINDLIMGITSISIKQYLVQQGDSKTKSIKLAVPFSLRDPTPNPKHFKLENDFVPITVELDLTLSLEESLKLAKKRMDSLKKSIIPSGQYYFMKFASYMPSFYFKYLSESVGQRHTFIFSNVPGPITPYQITGKKAKKSMFIVAGVGDLACGITIFSCHEIIKVSITADIANIPDCSQIGKIFDENFEKLLENSKQE